ncbi:MAG: DNA polymerase III subunit delta [Trueperella sp.]|nr:DNA polymerase III subunit delta [Trueperella sp.]
MAKWDIKPAPVVLIKSGEPAFGDRAVAQLRNQLREADPNIDITKVDAERYQTGQLATLVSPSLFAEARAVVVYNLEQLNSELQEDLLSYLKNPVSDVTVILRHNGGVRGRKVLTELKKQKVPTLEIAPLRNNADKARAVTDDVRAAGRKMTTDAVGALVDALGSDTSELLAAVRQLLADVDGVIDDSHVHTYFAGRVEATGFNVADALIAGNTGRAVELARHAVSTGVSPVAIVAAISTKLRTMAQVLGERSSKLDVKVKMAPWQRDRAKRDLRSWNANALAIAITEIARTDAEVKGLAEPGYALERGILAIGRARHQR